MVKLLKYSQIHLQCTHHAYNLFLQANIQCIGNQSSFPKKKKKNLIQYCQVTIFLLVFKMKFKLLIDKFKLLIDDKTAITLRKIHVPASVLPYIIEKTINARL